MIWQDRERTDPTKRKIIDENGVEQDVNIEEIESNITQSGTPVNATTMNNIEKNLGTYGNDTYDSTATYLEGETVTHNALLYRAKQDIETPEEWTAAHWEQTSALQELANTSGNEIAIGTEEDITRQTKALIKQGNYRYINSEIANEYGTATNIGYSQEYINGLNTYSADEIRIGTFLGKPLYRKVVTGTGPEVTTMGTAAANTTNIGENLDHVFMKEGYFLYSNDTILFPLLFTGANDTTKYCRAYIQKAGTMSRIVVQSNSTAYSQLEFVAVVEYTKTTD